jgi:hypothetical protein
MPLGGLSAIYDSPGKTNMKLVKIDSLVQNQLIPVPSFIKIDIEGPGLAA